MTTHQIATRTTDPTLTLLGSLLEAHELGPEAVRHASRRRQQRRSAAQARIRRLLA